MSCHFNPSRLQPRALRYNPRKKLAAKVSAGLRPPATDRGPKFWDGLAFLNGTDKPAILIETCFLDNQGDVDVYEASFNAICASIATAISGVSEVAPGPRPPRPPRPSVSVAITVPPGVELELSVNGEELLT